MRNYEMKLSGSQAMRVCCGAEELGQEGVLLCLLMLQSLLKDANIFSR